MLVAVLVGSAVLVATILTLVGEATVAGAVYKPFTTLPTAGLRDHVTPVLVLPVTVVVNCFDWPGFSEEAVGLNLTLTVAMAFTAAGASMIVALAIWVGSATLVAETVTREFEVTVLGAVYSPFTMEPAPRRIDHCTFWFTFPLTVAVNCFV